MTYKDYVIAYKTMLTIFDIGFPNATNDTATILKMIDAADVLANFALAYPEHSAKYDSIYQL